MDIERNKANTRRVLALFRFDVRDTLPRSDTVPCPLIQEHVPDVETVERRPTTRAAPGAGPPESARMLDAARRRFLADRYATTTLAAVAADAGARSRPSTRRSRTRPASSRPCSTWPSPATTNRSRSWTAAGWPPSGPNRVRPGSSGCTPSGWRRRWLAPRAIPAARPLGEGARCRDRRRLAATADRTPHGHDRLRRRSRRYWPPPRRRHRRGGARCAVDAHRRRRLRVAGAGPRAGHRTATGDSWPTPSSPPWCGRRVSRPVSNLESARWLPKTHARRHRRHRPQRRGRRRGADRAPQLQARLRRHVGVSRRQGRSRRRRSRRPDRRGPHGAARRARKPRRRPVRSSIPGSWCRSRTGRRRPAPRRFTTWFFGAEAPDDHDVAIDGTEIQPTRG